MELVAGPLLVFLAVICYVQCLWDQTANPEGVFINPRIARTLNRGRNPLPHMTAPYMETMPIHPTAPVLTSQTQSYNGSPSPTLRRGKRKAFALNRNLKTNAPNNVAQFSANWAKKGAVKFQFLNPAGLKILLPGDDINFRILAFDIKINEEFKSFDAGNYFVNISRTSDGQWSYYYPNLKLKQGDKIFHRIKVMFNRDMRMYTLKGLLTLTSSDPHNNLNWNRTTTPSPRPSYNSNRTTTPSPRPIYNSNRTTTPAPWPTNEVDNKPEMEGEEVGQPVKWDHKYYINKTNNDVPAPEEEQLLKNIIEKNIDFKFLNPSGMSILFSGENKDFRVLAFNIKLNEEFKTLGPGHYVANITRTKDGRQNYYYTNLKVRLADKVYYWIRVVLGKEMNDYIVTGELNLHGDPHIGGPVADVPIAIIVTQTQPRPTEASAALPNNQPATQASLTSPPVLENDNRAPIQVTSTQTPNGSNHKQPTIKW